MSGAMALNSGDGSLFANAAYAAWRIGTLDISGSCNVENRIGAQQSYHCVRVPNRTVGAAEGLNRRIFCADSYFTNAQRFPALPGESRRRPRETAHVAEGELRGGAALPFSG